MLSNENIVALITLFIAPCCDSVVLSAKTFYCVDKYDIGLPLKVFLMLTCSIAHSCYTTHIIMLSQQILDTAHWFHLYYFLCTYIMENLVKGHAFLYGIKPRALQKRHLRPVLFPSLWLFLQRHIGSVPTFIIAAPSGFTYIKKCFKQNTRPQITSLVPLTKLICPRRIRTRS